MAAVAIVALVAAAVAPVPPTPQLRALRALPHHPSTHHGPLSQPGDPAVGPAHAPPRDRGVPAMTSTTTNLGEVAVLDPEHVGDIRGALGTIARGDVSTRPRLSAKVKTLLAIVGPGLIVMVGDNDAGAFGTYIGASAVGLATAYAGADVLGVSHSLHRPVRKAKGSYACYAGLMVLAGALVLLRPPTTTLQPPPTTPGADGARPATGRLRHARRGVWARRCGLLACPAWDGQGAVTRHCC